MSSKDSIIFREKQASNKKAHHGFDDDTIESMGDYFKVENREELLRYINRRQPSALDLATS